MNRPMQIASVSLALVAALGLAPSRASAQVPAASKSHEGIIVQAVGTATGRPTHVEMSGKLSAEAELAADAIVKFNDAKKRAMAAIDGIKNPDLSVKSGGVSIATGMDSNQQQMMAMRGMATGAAAGQKVRITETSRIVMSNAEKLSTQELLDKLLKVLDVAKDSGFVFSQPYTNDYYEMQARAMEGDIVVTFKMPDSSALRDKAYKAAIDDAKARAEKIAELSGANLGRILSVQEAGTGENNMINAYVVYMNRRTGNTEDALSGVTSGELTMRVSLTVQFELVAGK